MSFATKYNRSTRTFDVDCKALKFMEMKDLYADPRYRGPWKIEALWISSKSKFGDHPIIATKDFLVSLPQHMCETCKEILMDPDAIADIKAGLVGFKVYSYEVASRVCYNVEFVDL